MNYLGRIYKKIILWRPRHDHSWCRYKSLIFILNNFFIYFTKQSLRNSSKSFKCSKNKFSWNIISTVKVMLAHLTIIIHHILSTCILIQRKSSKITNLMKDLALILKLNSLNKTQLGNKSNRASLQNQIYIQIPFLKK